jgi:hypothetical protein
MTTAVNKALYCRYQDALRHPETHDDVLHPDFVAYDLKICGAERLSAYAAALGERFDGRTLPDSAANPDVAPFFARHVPYPHCVVTQHLIDAAGQPTIAARDEILAFFARRLSLSS